MGKLSTDQVRVQLFRVWESLRIIKADNKYIAKHWMYIEYIHWIHILNVNWIQIEIWQSMVQKYIA